METRLREPNERSGIHSIEVGTPLLLALADLPAAASLSDLAARAGITPSKAHRYLASFMRLGLVEQNAETGRYDLGPAALTVGLAALRRLDPVRQGAAALRGLCDRLGETTVLTVWANKGPTIVGWEESDRPVTVNVRIGSVLPLTTSANGHIFLSWLPSAVTAPLVTAEGASAQDVAAVVARTRRDGLARVDGDLQAGIAALAAPVFGHDGRLQAAICIVAASRSLELSGSGAAATALRATADELTARLGGRGCERPGDTRPGDISKS